MGREARDRSVHIDLHGSCLCESIRFSVSGRVTDFYLCHCSRCRKETGSAFSTSMFVPLDAVTWYSPPDAVKRFELPSAEHFCLDFCMRCGSVVPYISRGHEFYIVPVGSLDSHIDIAPFEQIYWQDRASWYEAGVQCPRSDGERS